MNPTKNLADTELRIIQKVKDLIFDEVLAYSKILLDEHPNDKGKINDWLVKQKKVDVYHSISIELGTPIAEIILQEREKLEILLQKGMVSDGG